MLYLNKDATVQQKEYDWGKLRFIELGEQGRGRHAIRLPVPNGYKDSVIKAGLHKGLSIGLSKSGKERIIQSSDHDMYMALTSEGGYTRKVDGRIYLPVIHENEISVLQKGNGADGDAGRIGQWACALMKVPADKDLAISVVHGGSGREVIHMLHGGEVYSGSEEDMRFACDAMDMTPPFSGADDFWISIAYAGGAKEFASPAERAKDTVVRHRGSVKYLDLSGLSAQEKADIIAEIVKDSLFLSVGYDKRREDALGLWRSDKEGIEACPQMHKAISSIIPERNLMSGRGEFALLDSMLRESIGRMTDVQKTAMYHEYKKMGAFDMPSFLEFMPGVPEAVQADYIQSGGRVALDGRYAKQHSEPLNRCCLAGSEWESQLANAVEAQHVYDTENVRVFITDGPYTAASYYSPIDDETKAATVTLDARKKKITVALEDGGKEGRSALEIMRSLGDPEPKGGKGVAVSSWRMEMGAQDLVKAAMMAEEAARPQMSMERRADLEGMKKALFEAVCGSIQERGLSFLDPDKEKPAPSMAR